MVLLMLLMASAARAENLPTLAANHPPAVLTDQRGINMLGVRCLYGPNVGRRCFVIALGGARPAMRGATTKVVRSAKETYAGRPLIASLSHLARGG